jgi:hypothetical protein
MEEIPDMFLSHSLHGLVHEIRENIEEGMYYYVGVYDYTDDGTVNDCEYVARVLSKDADEIIVQVLWKRYLIEGNEQEWNHIELENMTFAWPDVDAPCERPCIRFYRTARQN